MESDFRLGQLRPVGEKSVQIAKTVLERLQRDKDVRRCYWARGGFVHLWAKNARDTKSRHRGWEVGCRPAVDNIDKSPAIVLGNYDDPLASGIHENHFEVYIHPESSVIMFRAGDSGGGLEYFETNSNRYKLLQPGQTVAAFSTTMKLRLAWTFEYTWESSLISSPENVIEFNKRVFNRNPALGRPYGFFPDATSTVFWRARIVMQRESIGGGSFATQHKAIDIETGELYAVKNQYIFGRQRQAFLLEYRLWCRVKNVPYILRPLQLFCEHDKDASTCKSPYEHIYLLTKLQHGSLMQQSRRLLRSLESPTSRSPFVIQKFFNQVLEGIAGCHKKGVMHRDIQTGNILISTLDPPIANICDFGKAIRKERDKETGIGPKWTCAPEIWGKNGYDQSIDLWSWAITMLEVLVIVIDPQPHEPREEDDNATRDQWEAKAWLGIDPRVGINSQEQVDSLQNKMMELKHAKCDDYHFDFLSEALDLLSGILVFDPKGRLTMDAALSHRYWQCEEPASEDEEEDESEDDDEPEHPDDKGLLAESMGVKSDLGAPSASKVEANAEAKPKPDLQQTADSKPKPQVEEEADPTEKSACKESQSVLVDTVKGGSQKTRELPKLDSQPESEAKASQKLTHTEDGFVEQHMPDHVSKTASEGTIQGEASAGAKVMGEATGNEQGEKRGLAATCSPTSKAAKKVKLADTKAADEMRD